MIYDEESMLLHSGQTHTHSVSLQESKAGFADCLYYKLASYLTNLSSLLLLVACSLLIYYSNSCNSYEGCVAIGFLVWRVEQKLSSTVPVEMVLWYRIGRNKKSVHQPHFDSCKPFSGPSCWSQPEHQYS